MRVEIRRVNPEQQIYGVISELDTWISDEPELQQDRLVSWIFSALAVMALALVAVGLYSVVSYTVAQRTNEFGIRMALGVQRGYSVRIVFSATTVSVSGGIVAGLALSFALNRIIARWVENNSPDAITLLAGTPRLAAASAIACLVPVLCASHIDPKAALRIDKGDLRKSGFDERHQTCLVR